MMTVKEQLHRIVDELDDERAVEVLAFALQRFPSGVLPGSDGSHAAEPGVDVDRESLWQVARPVTADDPLWGIVGMIDDGPTDVSTNKHRYLADAYGDLHEK